MKTIIDYRLIEHAQVKALNDYARGMIETGWQPYGSPFEAGEWVCQAFVKYDEEKTASTWRELHPTYAGPRDA